MSIIIPANSAVAGGYDVANSCRFDGAADFLKKARADMSTATNQKKFTISTWVKRSELGDAGMLWSSYHNATNYLHFQFQDSDAIKFKDFTGSTRAEYITTRLFRDVSAFYHILLNVDTTDGVAGDRQQIWINGVRETAFGTSSSYSINTVPEQGTTDIDMFVGREGGGADYYNGYLAQNVFIDGLALNPDSFGEFDEDSGVWKPIDVSELTFGNNGYYLDFEDSANLGNDANGGADFAETGLAAIDQTTDTCTNNFATLNPLANVIAPVTLTEGNLKIAMTNSKGGNLSTISCTDGKYYAEMKITTAPQDFRFHWGIMPHPVIAADDPINAANAGIMLSGYNAVIYAANGIINNFYGNATGRFSGNPILGLAIDLKSATRTIAISINGAWVTGSNATDTDFSNALKVDITSYVATYPNWFIGCGSGNGSGTTGVYELNFGNPIFTGTDQADGNDRGSFEYPPPSGYLALCTKNLSGELS